MSNLIQKKCVPWEDQLPLKEEEIKNYMAELKDDWEGLDPPSPGAPASPAKRGESARQAAPAICFCTPITAPSPPPAS